MQAVKGLSSTSSVERAERAERTRSVPRTRDGSREELTRFHRALAAWNGRRLTPVTDAPDWESELQEEMAWRLREGELIEQERAIIADRAAEAPRDADAFVAWFEALKENGPGQGDPLFPFLANEATYEQVHWFVTQEVAGEAGFDDLVALTQVKISPIAKLEMGRNYWDELGNGHAAGMHGPMLDLLAKELDVPHGGPVVWESQALGNVMTALATTRRFAYHSIGALGAIELTAPGRAELVNDALRRVGISGAARRYFALHAKLDIKHSAGWDKEVLHTLVSENPETARPIAEGALMRLEAGRRCFVRYREELGIVGPQSLRRAS
ncbi:MAG: hypothetical protein JWP97_1573 [Labilithrix sp.]|nr:hypothetical protein [Labilithrix sp.]